MTKILMTMQLASLNFNREIVSVVSVTVRFQWRV